eukprot:COSAG01_NODE_1542_length_9973_cov_11.546992_10_plen_63_part_00
MRAIILRSGRWQAMSHICRPPHDGHRVAIMARCAAAALTLGGGVMACFRRRRRRRNNYLHCM